MNMRKKLAALWRITEELSAEADRMTGRYATPEDRAIAEEKLNVRLRIVAVLDGKVHK